MTLEPPSSGLHRGESPETPSLAPSSSVEPLAGFYPTYMTPFTSPPDLSALGSEGPIDTDTDPHTFPVLGGITTITQDMQRYIYIKYTHIHIHIYIKLRSL